MKYDFIDIGCSIFDVSVDEYGLEASGILVEPVKEFIDVLPCSKTVLKENCAISFFNGESEFYAIIDKEKKLRYWSAKEVNEDLDENFVIEKSETGHRLTPFHMGTSSFHDPREEDFVRDARPYKVNVKTMRLKEFFEKYDVTSIEQLKLDCQGHDVFIVCQLIKLLRKKTIKVNKIIFEYVDWHPFNKTNGIADKLVEILEKEFNYTSIRTNKNYWSHDMELTLT